MLDRYNVEQLISDAGGFDDSAFANAAELRSLSVSAEGVVEYSYRTVTFDGEGRPTKTEPLQSRDVLIVKKLGNWQAMNLWKFSGSSCSRGPTGLRKEIGYLILLLGWRPKRECGPRRSNTVT